MADKKTKLCIYCNLEKIGTEFSDEHIWPDALGGDHLSRFWRTDEVCRACNSMSGVFVDGAFIRGWAGSMERGCGARDYMLLSDPMQTVLPLNYLGKLPNEMTESGEVADWWVGPCGATIVHIRPKESEEFWTPYLGGDPRAKKAKAGRAYIALASASDYWIIAALASFAKHFRRARRYVVNMDIPPEWKVFERVDRGDAEQAADLVVIDTITDAAKAGRAVKAQVQMQIDCGHRFLAKIALAIGCQLFGSPFTVHAQGADLRHAFRQANLERRREIPIRGTGYFAGGSNRDLNLLSWRGAWVLMLQIVDEKLTLAIITPSGRTIGIQITDDVDLIATLPADYKDGLAWMTVPTLGTAVGPLPLPDYIAHLVQVMPNAQLSAIEAAQIDPGTLPSC